MAAEEMEIREGQETRPVTVRFPAEVHEGLRVLSFATDTSVNSLVVQACRDLLTDKGHRQAVDAFADRFRERYRVVLDKLADM